MLQKANKLKIKNLKSKYVARDQSFTATKSKGTRIKILAQKNTKV